MSVPRISVAWLVVIFLAAIALFFAYHIGRTIYTNSEKEEMIDSYTKKAPPFYREEHPLEAPHEGPDYDSPSGEHTVAGDYPEVPGQTQEDLRSTDPIQATAPAYQYNSPGPKDPHAGPAYEPAEFGDNLRHPEGAFEMRGAASDGYIAASGMGSHVSSPGGNSAVGYSSETAQNAGEFMKGIFAFDGSMEGTAYSAL